MPAILLIVVIALLLLAATQAVRVAVAAPGLVLLGVLALRTVVIFSVQ